MGLLDGPLRQVAQILTQTLGGTVSLRFVESGSYNPETDADSPTTYQWDNVPNTPPEGYSILEQAQTNVEVGDFRVYVPAKYLEDNAIPEPAEGWTLVKDGAEYRVVSVARVYSGDQVALYELGCRK